MVRDDRGRIRDDRGRIRDDKEMVRDDKEMVRDDNYMKSYYIYIMTNKTNSTFYIGVTNDLRRRVFEHKNELIRGFTSKYKLKKLVYNEKYDNVNEAIAREKRLKNWHREWKINLIKSLNPDFNDLWDSETSSE